MRSTKFSDLRSNPLAFFFATLFGFFVSSVSGIMFAFWICSNVVGNTSAPLGGPSFAIACVVLVLSIVTQFFTARLWVSSVLTALALTALIAYELSSCFVVDNVVNGTLLITTAMWAFVCAHLVGGLFALSFRGFNQPE